MLLPTCTHNSVQHFLTIIHNRYCIETCTVSYPKAPRAPHLKCSDPFVPYTVEVVTVGCGGNGEPSTTINFTKQGGMCYH